MQRLQKYREVLEERRKAERKRAVAQGCHGGPTVGLEIKIANCPCHLASPPYTGLASLRGRTWQEALRTLHAYFSPVNPESMANYIPYT
jgi:hypothetical protein